MEKETGAGTASTDLSQTNSGSTEQASAGCCPIYGARPQVRGRGRPSGCAPPRAQVRGCAELCAGGAEGAQWSPAEAPALPFVPLPAIGAGRQSGDPAGNWGCGAVRATERAEPNWELGGGSGGTAHCGCRGAARPAGGRRDGTKRSPLHRGRAIPSVPRMGLQGRPVEVVKSYKPHRTVTKSGVLPFHYGCCHCVPSSHTVWIRCVEECDGTGITHTGQKHHAGFVSHSQPWPGLVTGPKEQGKDVPGQHVSKHLSWHQGNLCHSTTLLQCK